MDKIFITTSTLLYITSATATEVTFSEQDEKKESKMLHRVLKQENISSKDLEVVLSRLNLTIKDEIKMPKEGRIATNLVVNTEERGNVLVRAYPENVTNKLETGNFTFEVQVLHHLSNHGLRVPTPLVFNNQEFLYNQNGHVYIVYPFIPGNTLEKEDLSLDIARKSGEYISQLTKIATTYQPAFDEKVPEGDLAYLNKIFTVQSQKIPAMLEDATFKSMLDFINLDRISALVDKSPKGIVHSDFFFENFIIEEQKTAVIDFGDAYYGSVVMDISIAAMEFSATYDQNWNFNFLKEFLKPNLDWLNKNGFSEEEFIDIMKVNCLRFAIYTIPFTLAENLTLADNSYLLRFQYLSRTDIIKKIKNVFVELKSNIG